MVGAVGDSVGGLGSPDVGAFEGATDGDAVGEDDGAKVGNELIDIGEPVAFDTGAAEGDDDVGTGVL